MTKKEEYIDPEEEEIEFTPEDTGTSSEKDVKILEEELKTAQEELAKYRDKDLNFANLRKAKDKAEEDVKTLQQQVDEKIEAAKNEILESTHKDFYNDQLNELAGDDEEFKKKIEFHYNRIKDPASSKEEVSKKLRDSWLLASAKEDETPISNFSSGGVSKIKTKDSSSFTTEEKQLAQKLAQAGGLKLTEDDFK